MAAQTQGCRGGGRGWKGGTRSALHAPLDPQRSPGTPQLPPSTNLTAAETCAGVCSPPAPAAGGRGQSLEQRRRRGCWSRRRTGAGRLGAAAWALWGPGSREEAGWLPALAPCGPRQAPCSHPPPLSGSGVACRPPHFLDANTVALVLHSVEVEAGGSGIGDPAATGRDAAAVDVLWTLQRQRGSAGPPRPPRQPSTRSSAVRGSVEAAA